MNNVDCSKETDIHALSVELWCTIIEEEYTLASDNKYSHGIIKNA